LLTLNKQVLKDRAYIDELLYRCSLDMKFAAKTLFYEHFYRPFSPKIHDPIFAALQDKSLRYLNVISGRKAGKTTILNLAYPAYEILFADYDPYIVPISHTTTHSIKQSQNLKKEFSSNYILKFIIEDVWGDITGDEDSKEIWGFNFRNPDGEVVKRAIIEPRGFGQQIRGLISGNLRPNLYLVDDLWTLDDARSDMSDPRSIASKKWDWFHGDLLSSLSEAEGDYFRVINLGTPLGDNSLSERLAEISITYDEYLKRRKAGETVREWVTIRVPVCDESYNSYWEEQHPTEDLKRKAELFKKNKQYRVFCREYMAKNVAGDNAALEEWMFQIYYPETEAELNRNPMLRSMVIVDPAREADVEHDPTAITGVSIDIETGKIKIRESICENLHRDDIINEAFAMGLRLKASHIVVEDAGLGEHIRTPFINENIRRLLGFDFFWAKPRGKSKEIRVSWITPYLRVGDIQFNRYIADYFLQEGVAFPYGKSDHRLDTLAYIAQVMEECSDYFMPTGSGTLEDQKILENEEATLLAESYREFLAERKADYYTEEI